MLAFLTQSGAGLYIDNGGVANLDGCQVYENQAVVRAPVPGPSLQGPTGTLRTHRTFACGSVSPMMARSTAQMYCIADRTPLQRPAGTFRVLAFCMQMQGDGGGLFVRGTATLTNTNVYENVATSVHLYFEPL